LKTRWLVVGILTLGVAAAAPWGVGYYTERQWQGVATGFNSAQDVLRLETRDYDRGYLDASVRGYVTLVVPDSGEIRRIEYQARVSHGVTGSLMDFSTADSATADVEKFFPDEKPRLTLETRIWGTATVEITVPAVDVADRDTDETLTSARAYGRADIGSAGTEVDIRVQWPGLTLAGPDVKIAMNDFRVKQTMERLTGNLWLGSGRVELAGLGFELPQQSPVRFEGLSVVSSSDVSDAGARLNGESSIRLDKLTVDDRDSGPHEIQVMFDGLDVTSLDEISAAVNDMQQAAVNPAAETNPRAVMEQQMQSFQRVNAAILGLAAEGFSFGLPTIDLSTPEGPVRGELMIRHPQLSEQEKSRAMMVMQGLTGNFDISMPAALVDNNQALALQIAPLVEDGMVVQEGNRLRMAGTLEDMALTINGNVLPLPPIF